MGAGNHAIEMRRGLCRQSGNAAAGFRGDAGRGRFQLTRTASCLIRWRISSRKMFTPMKNSRISITHR